MDKYLIAARLDELQWDGQKLANSQTLDYSPGKIALWYARAIDTLTLFLPEQAETHPHV